MEERTSKFFCHSLSRFAFSAASISSSLALFLVNQEEKNKQSDILIL